MIAGLFCLSQTDLPDDPQQSSGRYWFYLKVLGGHWDSPKASKPSCKERSVDESTLAAEREASPWGARSAVFTGRGSACRRFSVLSVRNMRLPKRRVIASSPRASLL